eukprot:CAMPEP_0170321982 /NCGR_PEP_ID=MMETSP0116_2-20130129/61763_1 /TAXON_ID=400756 /ORGANISM="Durinskia baltica, Strain CSIRO CS-38" /LENGTH=76 /DNA_ID=CAMNT_0010574829 /DNA_START=183 /DNA_END=414 /DNA_ORIENTATION=+
MAGRFKAADVVPDDVVEVPAFLVMRDAPPHETLQFKGLLHEFEPIASAVTIFVSNHRCDRDHPDPHFRKLAVLQGF